MIVLTRLNQTKLLVNLETVKFIESTPDTLITFLNGDSLMVLESLEEIQAHVLEFKRLSYENSEMSSPT